MTLGQLRPNQVLRSPLSVTQIHGGVKARDRSTPGTRLCVERGFRDSAQVLVATEAADKSINLEFSWFMTNSDIPWHPVRFEHRMGGIPRYGQGKDRLIVNFASTNARAGHLRTASI